MRVRVRVRVRVGVRVTEGEGEGAGEGEGRVSSPEGERVDLCELVGEGERREVDVHDGHHLCVTRAACQ